MSLTPTEADKARNDEMITNLAHNAKMVAALIGAQGALVDAAQILDAAKAEWELEGAWSAFDQTTREKVSLALAAIDKLV